MEEKEKIVPKLNKEMIESMVYEVRGKKVILDFELAMVLGYDSKRLNELVKRNAKYFSDDSKFRITKDEFYEILNKKNKTKKVTTNAENVVAQSQIATAQIWATNNGGRTTLPYAFTENGVMALKDILKIKNEYIRDNFALLNNILNKRDDEKCLNEADNYNVVKFESGNIMLDVHVSPDEDTVWLTQNDLAILFDTTVQNISMHITNIFDENELEKNSVFKKSLTTASDGKTYNVTYYNLDMTLSIGYRVNTKRGIEFRRWASSVLKQYLIKGYAINTKRCLEHSDIMLKLSSDVKLLNDRINELSSRIDEKEKEINELISNNKLINKKLDIVMENFIDPNTYRHYLILDGEKIEADVAYQTIYKLAKTSIFVIDDYIDVKTLLLLKVCESIINIMVFTDNKARNKLSSDFINDFMNDTGFNISFKQNKDRFHDRYIVLDYGTNQEVIYHCGSSSKDSGKRITTIDRIAEREVYDPLIDEILSHEDLIV